MMRRLTLVLATLVVAASGCGGGGDGKDAYARDLAKAHAALERALAGIAGDIREGLSGDRIGAKLDEGARALDRAAGDFRAIDAPADAQSAHRKIVAGLGKLAALYRDSADAARANDVVKLRDTLAGLQTSAGYREILQAKDELRRKGYAVAGG